MPRRSKTDNSPTIASGLAGAPSPPTPTQARMRSASQTSAKRTSTTQRSGRLRSRDDKSPTRARTDSATVDAIRAGSNDVFCLESLWGETDEGVFLGFWFTKRRINLFYFSTYRMEFF